MSANIFESIFTNEKRTEGEQYLLDVFESSERFDGWTIFEQPHINSMKPDFVLLHPNKGIIIIEVKDWNLSLNTYESGGYIKGNGGNLYRKNPIKQVEKYKQCILKSDLENSEDFISKNSDYYGYIETIVYFHGASKSQAINFCGFDKYTKIWTDEDIDYIADINNRLNSDEHTFALSLKKSKYDKDGSLQKIVKELTKNLQYADYNYERRNPFVLTKEQSNLAELKQNSIRRWGGVAGAGKSLVLTEKAVKALKKGYRVLILTFNITLRHYLRDLCSQQFGKGEYDGERKKLKKDLTILHFHDFLKILMAEHEIDVDSAKSNTKNNTEKDFTEEWMDAINRYLECNPLKDQFNYDYILIDEGQDFKGDWIRFLKKFFTKKGEIFIVYDKAQDLYEHGVWIEDSDQIKDIGFRGKPGILKYSYRMPKAMIEKITLVRENLGIKDDDILIPKKNNIQINFLSKIQWINCSKNSIENKIENVSVEVNRLKESSRIEDITILTTNENTGVAIVEFFKKRGIEVSHVYDMNREKDIDKRRSEKWKFVGGTGKLKVCSYQSYKGWQTPNIILVLDAADDEAVEEHFKRFNDCIFISMSRVKPNSSTGQYSFICFNYLTEYNDLEKVFE